MTAVVVVGIDVHVSFRDGCHDLPLQWHAWSRLSRSLLFRCLLDRSGVEGDGGLDGGMLGGRRRRVCQRMIVRCRL